MFESFPPRAIAIIVFPIIILANYLGARWRKSLTKDGAKDVDKLGPAEGSLLGLMTLLLAFSFSMAASKFEKRREIIVEEANNIGTAILRCDLYPDSSRSLMLIDFKAYVASRREYYEAGTDEDKMKISLKRADSISSRIWKLTAYLAQDLKNMARTNQMVPALNHMIDIVTTRETSRLAMVPPLIVYSLLILTVLGSFLVGYGQTGSRHPVIMFLFAMMTSLTIYLVMELDKPRQGLINLNTAEERILELEELLKNR